MKKSTIESEVSQEIFDEWTWETIERIVAKCGVFCDAGTAYLDGSEEIISQMGRW